MLSIKKIGIFIIFCLMAWPAMAFDQDYEPLDADLERQTYFDLINIEPSWSYDLEINKEVVVAVLDSGIDLDHPDLRANIWENTGEIAGDGLDNDNNSYIDDTRGWDFINSDNNPEPDLTEDYDYIAVNHGTVVAGIIAATTNTIGVVGIAPQAKIMPLRILNSKGSGNTLVLSQAIDYAVENGADIINMSLVGPSFDDYVKQSIIRAYDHGVMIIAASGNEDNLGISLDIDPRYPVCEVDSTNRILGVAAVDENKKLAVFSNYGEDCIDISAPGKGFYSTSFTESYAGGWNGTSVAAPIVSAAAALIKMHFSDLSPYEIYNILRATSQSLVAANPNHYVDLGAGLVDVGAALNYADQYYNQSVKIILAPEAGLAPEILLMDSAGNLEDTFLAYGANFKGGVNLAVGDLNNDGQQEIITAPRAGGGPHIRVFDKNGNLQSEFFAYDARFTGGVNIAVGDVDGDGDQEIVTAPGIGGGPHIRVFDKNGNLQSEFFAYENNFYGGVNLAVGDLTNDGQDEIVTAPASGREPNIMVFDQNRKVKGNFLAYDKSMTHGVRVSIGDINSDAWAEIVTIPSQNTTPQIKLFSSKGRDKGSFTAYSRYLTGGADVLARDISGDGHPEILTLPNKGSASLLRIYDAAGLEKDNLYLRDAQDTNGYNFEILFR